MNVLRTIENIRKDVLNFEDMFIESDMPDCFSRIYESENPTVSARELHEKLNIKTAFKDWFPRMCDYGFEESKDFWTKMSKSTGGRPSTQYELSIDMAKIKIGRRVLWDRTKIDQYLNSLTGAE